MNRKEIAEIRRRLNPEQNAISCVRGENYVNEKREIVSVFTHSLLTLPMEETEKYLSLFKRTLSGVPNPELVGIGFFRGSGDGRRATCVAHGAAQWRAARRGNGGSVLPGSDRFAGNGRQLSDLAFCTIHMMYPCGQARPRRGDGRGRGRRGVFLYFVRHLPGEAGQAGFELF